MDTKALTVLVVDDTEAQRYAVAHALRREGMSVIQASSGEEALRLSTQQPDLILLDVKLPDIDGFELCQRLKANLATSAIPVIQFSAHFVNADDRVGGLQGGADDYIANPTTEELVIKVKVWGRVRRAEAELRRKNEELAHAKTELELRLKRSEEAERERARAEAILDASRKEALFFANALQESSQAFAAGTTDGSLLHFNDAFVRLTGYSAEELKSATWSDDLTPPEWRERERKMLKELHRTRQPQVYEKEYIRKDGTRVPLEIKVHLSKNADGTDYYYAFLTDITNRKRSESRLRRFFDTNLFAILYWTIEGGVIDVNDKFLEMTGYTRDDVLAGRLNWSQMTPAEYHAMDEDARRQVRETGVHLPYEKEYIRKDGTRVWGLFAAAAWEDNRNEGVSFIIDISQRKRADEALRAERDFSKAVLQTASALIVVLDREARILQFNRACEELTGYSAAEACGRPVSGFIPPEEMAGIEEQLNALGAGTFPTTHENHWITKDGKRRLIAWTNTCLTGADGRVEYFVATGIDITDRKQAEQELRDGEARYRQLFEKAEHTAAQLRTIVESMHERVYVCDPDGNPILSNAGFNAFYSGQTAPVFANDYDAGIDAFTLNGRYLPVEEWPVRRALRGEQVREMELKVRYRHSGVEAVNRYNATPVHGSDGNLIMVVLTVEDITERKRAEQALRDSEERFRSVAENMSEGLAIFDAEGNIRYQNPAALRIHGFEQPTPDEPVKDEFVKHAWEARDDKGRPLAPEQWPVARILRHEAFHNQILHARRLDKEVEFDASFNGSPLYDGSGKLIGGFTTIRDITDEVAAAKALRESEAQFRTLANAIPTLCWMAYADGSIFWYNERWYQYTGATPEQMAGWGWQSVHDPTVLPQVLQRWKRSIATGQPFEMVFPLRGADGVMRPFLTRIVPIKDSEGKVVRWFGTNTDVTELREAQDALRQSEARFRATVENIPQMVWVAGRSAGFRYLSPKWLAYTGTTDEQNATGGWIDCLHPEDREKALERWNTAVATNGAYEAEYRLRRYDGEYRWHFSRAVPITESQDGEPLWFGTTTDVHDQKRTQELLIRSEKVAALGRMAASLAHDINNPLAAAMNALFLARTGNGQDKELDDYLQTVDEELTRISHITRQALGFYRESSKSAPVAVDTIMDEAVAILRSKLKVKRIQVDKSYKSDCIAIANAGELRQVFCNLLANSVDAVPDQGTVKLRVSRRKDPKTGGESVRILVADSGTGIDKNFMSQLFEPLFSTKGSVGTGLGLWVSKQLIEKHGGSIRVRSCTGGKARGTTFAILLPASTSNSVKSLSVGLAG